MTEIEGFDGKRLGRIDDWMKRYVDEGKFPGSSVLVARNGTVVHRSATGYRSIANKQPFETDTIVRIYSMTKPITSVAIMMLVERGLFPLSTPISVFLPEFSDCHCLIKGATSLDQTEPCPAPTIHQLLTHTSGLTYSFNQTILSKAYAEQTLDYHPYTASLEQNTRAIAALPLGFRPGAHFDYSVSIDVLGRLVEVVTGKTLDQFFQEDIFDPLAMTETGFSVPPDRKERLADCYIRTEANPLSVMDRAEDSVYLDGRVTTFSGGGGLLSTLADYFRFAEMLRQGGALNGERLLSPKTVAFMQQNHLASDIASMDPTSFVEMPMDVVGFGIGGAVVSDPARMGVPGSVGDYGWGGMASTFFWIDPVEQLTVIFFTQLVPSGTYPNRSELKALVHGALIN